MSNNCQNGHINVTQKSSYCTLLQMLLLPSACRCHNFIYSRDQPGKKGRIEGLWIVWLQLWSFSYKEFIRQMFSPICFPNFDHEFFSVWAVEKENKVLIGYNRVSSQSAIWKRNHNKYGLNKFVDLEFKFRTFKLIINSGSISVSDLLDTDGNENVSILRRPLHFSW